MWSIGYQSGPMASTRPDHRPTPGADRPPGRGATNGQGGPSPPERPDRRPPAGWGVRRRADGLVPRQPAMIPPMPELRSIAEARADVLAHVRPLGSEEVAVERALGRHLVDDVRAAADVPAFANSAMDGFAVRSGPGRPALRLVGESRAGAPFAGVLGDGEAVRTSTGAAVPEGADGVLQLELAEEDPAAGTVDDARRGRGRAQRARGRQRRARRATTVLRAGTRLGPGRAGRRGVGRPGARARRAPSRRVAVLTTGDELRRARRRRSRRASCTTPTAWPSPAWSPAKAAASSSRGALPDRPDATRAAIAAGPRRAPGVVLLSGGVSVGPHDHVKPALAHLGVEEVFWRVALRPGQADVVRHAAATGSSSACPGNPVSSMVTFLLFVRPGARGAAGRRPPPRGRAARG